MSDHEKLVEEVAKAIRGNFHGLVKAGLSDETWNDIARAALATVAKALENVTPGMVANGESAASIGIGKPVDDEAIPRIWSAMLAASPLVKEQEQAK